MGHTGTWGCVLCRRTIYHSTYTFFPLLLTHCIQEGGKILGTDCCVTLKTQRIRVTCVTQGKSYVISKFSVERCVSCIPAVACPGQWVTWSPSFLPLPPWHRSGFEGSDGQKGADPYLTHTTQGRAWKLSDFMSAPTSGDAPAPAPLSKVVRTICTSESGHLPPVGEQGLSALSLCGPQHQD